MFDLPVVKPADLRAYRQFRKFLMQDGYFMMQESVYCKLAPNTNAANAMVDRIKRNKPSAGTVSILTITEKQYSNMVMVVGSIDNEFLQTTDRTVIL